MNFTKEQVASCINSSTQSCLGASPTPADVLLYMTVAAVIFVTVCGNLLVIISICHFKQLHTPTNLLLLSLAVADFLVGVTVMPFNFSLLLKPNWCFGAIYCITCNVASFHLTCVSIYNVAFIAVDRYVAVSNPFLYCTKMPVNITLRTLSIMWLCSFIYNVLLLYFNEAIPDMKGNITCLDCLVTFNEIWTIVDFVVIFLLPCMAIIILYMKIFYVAKRHANKINCAKKKYSNGTENNNTSMTSESKAAKRLGILVLVFLLCMVPYCICTFLEVFIKTPDIYLAVSSAVPVIYINSAINPIIYALLYPWFQKSVKLILTLRICGPESSIMNVLVKET